MPELALAFDMGGSKVVAGLVTRDGRILWRMRSEWTPHNGREVMEALESLGKSALMHNPNLSPDAIGATIPGVANPDTGTWVSASFSGIHDLPVSGELNRIFNLPAFADNDCRACALAERMFGAGIGCNHFVYLTVSNGVGSAIFSGGQLLRGANNGAGELGHCTVEENGRLCRCGKRGCLEMYAAGPGLSSTYQELYGGKVNGKQLADMARAGDENALRVWRMEGCYLGRAIAFAANLLNPQKVIIGGGLSLAMNFYRKALWETIEQNLFVKVNQSLEVLATPLGYDGGLLGAAALAFQNK